jgi:ribonuclease G
MTRQNVTDGPREVMTKKCPTCGGDGIVVSEHTAAVDVERRLRSLVTPGSRDKAFKVEVAAKVAALVVGPGGTRLRELEETTRRRFFLVGKDDEHLDHFRVLDQGTLEKVAPKLSVDIGREVEVKLGEVGLHDAHAGVGKLDGVDVVVGNAAKLVGKKVKARITAVTEGLAWAELLVPVEQTREPLTAESEAEKPTRARRATTTRKKDEVEVEVEQEDEDEVVESEVEPEAGDVGEAGADADGSPAKKRTRRGTRGGRNRKRKTGAAAAAANGGEPEAGPSVDEDAPPEVVAEPEAEVTAEPERERDVEPAPGPVIHVPDRDLGADGSEDASPEDGDAEAAPKKRTRRGSRGGKNRRKKTAAPASGATATVEADAPPAEDEPSQEEPPAALERDEPSPNGASDDEWEYTPMSEWGIDER